MQLPRTWKLVPCCSCCAAVIAPNIIEKIDAVLDRAVTEGGQQTATIVGDVGKALTGESAAPSFFSEAGQRASEITTKGVHWRLAFDTRRRMEMFAKRAKERAGILGKKVDDEVPMQELEDPANECRFCGRKLQP
jgi:hypothetical protein